MTYFLPKKHIGSHCSLVEQLVVMPVGFISLELMPHGSAIKRMRVSVTGVVCFCCFAYALLVVAAVQNAKDLGAFFSKMKAVVFDPFYLIRHASRSLFFARLNAKKDHAGLDHAALGGRRLPSLLLFSKVHHHHRAGLFTTSSISQEQRYDSARKDEWG